LLAKSEISADPPDPPRSRRATPIGLIVLASLFALTGGTALLAEQVFEKLLSTLLGASTPAAATVLAVYFGGLTAGGLLYGQVLRRRVRRPLKAYALLEGTVAVWALFLCLAFDRLIGVFAPFLALGNESGALLQVCRVVVAGCWILPATIPMGASFPSIVDALEGLALANPGRAISGLYACNLLGAIGGAFLGPFVAFPTLGMDGTLLLVFSVNALVSLAAFTLARTHPDRERPAPAAGSSPEPLASTDGAALLAGVAFLSGYLFFSLEVVWTQLIGTVIGNSVYAFAAMLAMVLAGLGLGAALISLRFPNERHIPSRELGRTLLAGAIVAALMSGLWPSVPGALARMGGSIDSFAAAEALRWAVAAVLLIPPATAFGMIFPALFRLDVFPVSGSGATAGTLVAANSVGSILGALSTGFGLIPAVGSELSLRLLASLAALLALPIGLIRAAAAARRGMLVFSAAALAAVWIQPKWNRLALTSGEQVYFGRAFVDSASLLRYFREDTVGGFTTVVENPSESGPVRTLLTNGKFQGNDSGEMEGQTGFALTPMLFAEKFDQGLSIGLGTGRTAYAIAAMGVPSVDIAEIAPGIVGAADDWFSHVNRRILRAPQARLFLEDGRNLLLLREKRYDLITVEVTSVWFAGATNLYSREFYELARRRLKTGGVFQQWIQVHHIGFEELSSAIVTVGRVFPHVSFWVVGGQGLIIASDQPQQIQPGFLARIERYHDSVGWSGESLAKRFEDLLASRLLAPEDVSRMSRLPRFRSNTDRNRYLEYATPRYNNAREDVTRRNIRALARFGSYPPPLLAPDAKGPLAEAARKVGLEQYLRRHGFRLVQRP